MVSSIEMTILFFKNQKVVNWCIIIKIEFTIGGNEIETFNLSCKNSDDYEFTDVFAAGVC